jgi:hypothetical protein
MKEMSFDEGIERALDALVNDRLAVLCGAGLSMAPPSCLPNAAVVASTAKQRYSAFYGATRPPLPDAIEDQAEYFFQRGELATVYFRTLVDFDAFAGRPNAGHYAMADLLLVRCIQTAVTTNVDVLIETAGQYLFGQIGAGIDGDTVALLPPERAPLLKLHGCRVTDPANMVWAPGQLAVEPVSSRIASSEQWLTVRLLDRDLVIVGYWTDWDYLNAALAQALGAVRPARVIVVNPADAATFQAKAPGLYALTQRAAVSSHHVAASGSDFLEALRLAFASSFLRRVLYGGIDDYHAQTGNQPIEAWSEPPPLGNDALWQVRRDLEGCAPHQPARDRNPPNEPLLGLTLLQLRARGAVPDGPYWILGGRRIRILRASNRPLHRVQAEHDREDAPVVAPDLVIAVGAESQALAFNVVRAGGQATIARGSASRWITRAEAVEELGL